MYLQNKSVLACQSMVDKTLINNFANNDIGTDSKKCNNIIAEKLKTIETKLITPILAPTTIQEYPYIKNFYFNPCATSTSAEIALTDTISGVASININANSLAGEFRKYINISQHSKDWNNDKGFFSIRTSTRKNLSFGIGLNSNNSLLSNVCIGAKYSCIDGTTKPFISISF